MSEKKGEEKGGFVSQDRKKMGSYYNFGMDEAKIQQISKRSRKSIIRFGITGVVFGFFTEWLLGNSKIYDNIIKKTTMRRLNAKKKEDERIGEKLEKKQRSVSAQRK